MILYKIFSITCISVLPYLFSLHGDFVFDDSEAVVKNKDVSSNSWFEPFSNDFWGTNIQSNLSHKSYRPLTILTFRLNYIFSGNQLLAAHFKITNLLCHATCCLLAWQTFENILNTQDKIITKKWWTDTAYLSSLMFSVHPVHVEAVSGIVGRADILAAITFFIAFLSYIKAMYNRKLKYFYIFTTIITSAISMLFKENGITVLGFCLVYEFVKKFKWNKIINTSKLSINIHLDTDSIIRIVLVSAAIMALLYGRWSIMGRTAPDFNPTDNPAAFSNDVFTKIATYNYIYFLNFLLLVWPQWLCYDWSMRCVPLIENTQDYRFILVLILYLYSVLILLALFNQRNKTSFKRHVILSVSLIIIPFLPASNIFYPVGFVIAERVLYIPSAGYCLLVAIGFNKLIHKRNGPNKIGLVVFVLLLLIYALKSWHRSLVWQNEYILFTSGLSVCPLNAKVHYNVAKVADASRQTEWALREYKEAIRLYPEYYQAMNNLANLLKHLKQFDEAEFYLRSAISHKQELPAAWMNLGIVLANTGRYNESQIAYKTALIYRKNCPDCFYNLGNLYFEINKTENALANWFKAISLNPTHVSAWTNILALLDNTGQLEKALKLIPNALAEVPDAPSINFAVANIYGKIDRYEDAEKHFIRAIELFDKQVQAIHYANLGVLYHRWKKYQLAEKIYKKSLKIDPHFKSALRNLKSLQKLTK